MDISGVNESHSVLMPLEWMVPRRSPAAPSPEHCMTQPSSRRYALATCPAQLRGNWTERIDQARLPTQVVSFHEIATDEQLAPKSPVGCGVGVVPERPTSQRPNSSHRSRLRTADTSPTIKMRTA